MDALDPDYDTLAFIENDFEELPTSSSSAAELPTGSPRRFQTRLTADKTFEVNAANSLLQHGVADVWPPLHVGRFVHLAAAACDSLVDPAKAALQHVVAPSNLFVECLPSVQVFSSSAGLCNATTVDAVSCSCIMSWVHPCPNLLALHSGDIFML